MYTWIRRVVSGFTISLVLSLAATGAALATNLVANGSFETGDFTGWSLAQSDFCGVIPATQGTFDGFPVNLAPEDGTYAAALSPDSTDTLTQTLSTTPGQNYTITYYLASDPASVGYGSFGSSFGSTTVQSYGQVPFSTLDPTTGYPEWVKYTDVVAATSTSTVLTFTFSGGSIPYYPTYLGLDNVSVTPTATPESSTSVGFGLLAALGAVLLFVPRAARARASS